MELFPLTDFFQTSCDRFKQSIGGDGLEQILNDLSAGEHLSRRIEITVAAEPDHGYVIFSAAELFQQGDAVHTGHTDIKYHNIRFKALNNFQSVNAVFRFEECSDA